MAFFCAVTFYINLIMFVPDLETCTAMFEKSGLVPVYQTIIADLDTPLTLFAKVAGKRSHGFLFESMEGGEKWGRYSFIGLDPLVTFTSRMDEISLFWPDRSGEQQKEKKSGCNPIDELKKLLDSFSCVNHPGLPRFYGGAVGFHSYDMVRFVEDIPDSHAPLEQPDSSFMVPRLLLIHDARQQSVTIVCNLEADQKRGVADIYKEGCRRIEEIISLIRGPVPVSDPACDHSPHQFSSNLKQEEFAGMVEKAREYILAGDIIQVVLSQRLSTVTRLDPFVLYRALRHINPSPYLFYLRLDKDIMIGSSPEILVRLEDNEIELRPIAGTRMRGSSREEDEALKEELLADPKERAEHLMLVDLGRNDVGRVAKPGSVRVSDLMFVEKYSHVMHIVSGVHGSLADNKNQFDVFKACFPAGTVSGAAKIRAMEIIDELETERRGSYAGAVGYFGFSGNMDFCITIRTFVLRELEETGEFRLMIQAGAGIVADSDPDKEYEETLNKAKGLRRAVELAEKGLNIG
jgi:anthranilate synthase component 1